jgi:hypothetical protein
MATTNLFNTAKTVTDPTPKKKKGEKTEVFIGESLDTYSAIDTMIKTLTGIKDVYRNDVLEAMTKQFVKETLSTKTKPENFKGLGNQSEASCELRKRSSASVLSAAEVALLDKYNVTTETVVTTPAQEEKFFFNPKLVADPKLANKISKALSSIPELANIDVLLREAPKEEVSVQVASDKSFFDAAANINNAEALKHVYGIIATVAIKPKMTTDDLKAVLSLIEKTGISLSK